MAATYNFGSVYNWCPFTDKKTIIYFKIRTKIWLLQMDWITVAQW